MCSSLIYVIVSLSNMTKTSHEVNQVPRIMNLKEIGKLLFISNATIYRWIKGGMPHLQVMKGGKLLFDIDKVITWMVTSGPAIQLKIQKIRRMNYG